MKVGICGIGKMGAAMAGRLVEVGHDAILWNRTRARADALAGPGITVADSAASLARQADAVICMYLDEGAQDGVYGGESGLCAGLTAAHLVIDMSTVKPEGAGAAAERVGATGADFIECPVGGTVAPAKTGKLLGMAGGTQQAFERAKPLLEQLCRRVEHVGPVGTGSAMKLAINLPLAVYWEALGEALSIAVASGVDPDLAGDILGDSSGAASVAKPRIPIIVAAIRGEMPGAPAFDLSGMAKDLRLMQEHAASLGFEVPAAAAARGAFEAAAADGRAERDAILQAAWKCRNSTER
ncbi:MAG: NAD(P)-dependent oxidoreductase [Proteobacteria bacterium]|nr:NAD(P)-dependent oxidoreductase [Pseudomonadota bacterium]